MAQGIPLAPIRRIIKANGAEKVSLEAVELLRDKLEQLCADYSHDACVIAKHAGRKTVNGEDITIVTNDLSSSI